MRTAVFLLLMVLAWAVPAPAQPDTGTGLPPEKQDNRFIDWQSYRDATARSKAEEKPLMIYFLRSGDAYCRKLDLEALADVGVIRTLNTHFAMTKVDVEKIPAMARKYEVTSVPTLWFLDGDGRRLTHVNGGLEVARLQALLDFIRTGAYTEESFEDWRERRK